MQQIITSKAHKQLNDTTKDQKQANIFLGEVKDNVTRANKLSPCYTIHLLNQCLDMLLHPSVHRLNVEEQLLLQKKK
jgi:hypothetical protein